MDDDMVRFSYGRSYWQKKWNGKEFVLYATTNVLDDIRRVGYLILSNENSKSEVKCLLQSVHPSYLRLISTDGRIKCLITNNLNMRIEWT